jgi:beta-mannosidase
VIRLGDPYFRFNELSWNWIPQSCWEYKSEAITVLNTDSDYPLLLKLDSIDTVAEVFFNNVFLGTCENAFHPHFFEIPTNIITSEANVVTLRFWPILNVTLYKQNVYPYEVPSTQNYNVWAEPSHRSFVRKPGYDMGWDWGPAFLPQGVSGKVHLLQHIEPKIEHVIVHPYIDLRSKTATVNIFVMSERNESLETESFMENVGGTNLKVESWFEVYVDDKFQFKVHTWALKTPSPTLGVLLGKN